MSDTPRTDAARRWYQKKYINQSGDNLKKFGGHLPFCDEAMRSACKECICGWEKIKESLDNS